MKEDGVTANGPDRAYAETLYIMELMDGLRRKWGVRYPMDD